VLATQQVFEMRLKISVIAITFKVDQGKQNIKRVWDILRIILLQLKEIYLNPLFLIFLKHIPRHVYKIIHLIVHVWEDGKHRFPLIKEIFYQKKGVVEWRFKKEYQLLELIRFIVQLGPYFILDCI